MIEQPTLTDGVVWLTPFTNADGTALGDFNLDAEHRRWFDQPPVDPDPDGRRQHGEEVAERWRRAWTTGAELTFAVRLAADGEAIGTAELQPEATGVAFISYSIVPSHRRRGYATRAVRLLADAGLQTLGFSRIELRCDVDNIASARTAERAGFVFDRIDPGAGVFEEVEAWRGTPRDERVYHLGSDDPTG
jgi:[ribosomal protein S5]-alanine N-acetyltransferase